MLSLDQFRAAVGEGVEDDKLHDLRAAVYGLANLMIDLLESQTSDPSYGRDGLTTNDATGEHDTGTHGTDAK